MHGEKHIKGTAYRTLDQIHKDMAAALDASSLPHDLVRLGRSARDNPINAACLGDGDFTKPELLFFSGTHAMEFVGPAMTLGLLRHVAAQDPDSSVGRALEHINIWFLPVLNPDGYLRIQRRLASGPLGLAYGRTNANGVDLNRNFPTGFYENRESFFAGSTLKFSPYFRGKEPCSEPESRVFRDFVLNRNFRVAVDFHCFGNFIGYPYGFSDKPCRDADTFQEIAREMVRRQKRHKYRIIPMHKLYKVSGDVCDWLYDECRILAFTMEIAGLGFNLGDLNTALNPFHWANPQNPDKHVENNLEACLYLIDATMERFGYESAPHGAD